MKARIESLGGSIIQQAIGAYRQVTATDKFKEIERLRSRDRHNEASALRHAKDTGRAERDIEIAKKTFENEYAKGTSRYRSRLNRRRSREHVRRELC